MSRVRQTAPEDFRRFVSTGFAAPERRSSSLPHLRLPESSSHVRNRQLKNPRWQIRTSGPHSPFRLSAKSTAKMDLLAVLVTHSGEVDQLGSITLLMACTTPLEVSTSAMTTSASLTNTLPSVRWMVTSCPFTVAAFMPSVRSVDITLPAIT